MAPLRRPLLLALVALLAPLAACGVKAGGSAGSDGSGSSTASADEREPLSPEDEELLDVLVDTYTTMGFTDEEAECLGRGLLESGTMDAAEFDMTAVMDLINECDIPLSRMMEIGEGSGATSFEDGARIGMIASLESQGLDTERAECVADAYLEEVGGATPEELQLDYDRIADFFEQCDVSPEDFED